MAAIPVKKRCENSEEYTYTGKESSPLGLGYTAFACDLGTKMVGRDKTMWMVSMKNNVKVWVRIPTAFAEEAVASTSTPVKEAVTPVKKKTAKKKEAEPALQLETVADDVAATTTATTEPAEPVAPAKKKAATKKQPPKEETTPQEADVATPSAAPVKKKAATKKAPAADGTPAPARTPNKYNLYMKVRLAKLKDEHPTMPHTERLSKAASEWRTMTMEEKDKLIAELNE